MESDDPRFLALLVTPRGNLSFGLLTHQTPTTTPTQTILTNQRKKSRGVAGRGRLQRQVERNRQKKKLPSKRRKIDVESEIERRERHIVLDSAKRRGQEEVRDPIGPKEKAKGRRRIEVRARRNNVHRETLAVLVLPRNGKNPRIRRNGRVP